MTKDAAAVSLGTRGGRSRSTAKAEAARENGRKGGRPPKLCPECGKPAREHRWRKGVKVCVIR